MNHPPGCMCGFGGVGHAGQRRQQAIIEYPSHVPRIRPVFESYVNPNAKCPVCGAAVFYYQAPAGGRVFFDELGPPWPKHPCTDNSSVPASLYSYGVDPPARTPSWLRRGWRPLFILRVLDRHKYVYEIKCKYQESTITVYFAKRRSRHPSFVDSITRDTIAVLRWSEIGRHEVSLISRSGDPIPVSAYSHLSEAIQQSRLVTEGEEKSKEQTRSVRQGSDYCIGTVKWFNTTKGYGFIRPNDRQEDVFVHSSALERSGIAALLEGQRVRCGVGRGRKGLEARWIKIL